MIDRTSSSATALHLTRSFLLGIGLFLAVGPIAPALRAESKLRVNVFVDRSNEADPNSIRTAVNRWAASLSPDQDVKLNAKVESRRSRWNDMVKSGNFDLCGLYCYQYLELEDTDLLRPALVTTAGNGASSTFLLLTRTADDIQSIEDLQGKKIVVNTGGSGELPLIWLATKIGAVSATSEIPNFATISQVQTPARALLPLYFGNVDACILSRSAYIAETDRNHEITAKLSETHKSEPLLISMFAFNREFPVATAEKFSARATTTESEAGNKSMLEHLRRSGLVRFQERALDSVRALYAEYNSLFKRVEPKTTPVPAKTEEDSSGLSAQKQEGRNLTLGFPMSSFVSNSPSDARVATDVFLKHVFSKGDIPYRGEAFELEEEFLAAASNGEIDVFLINVDLYLKHEKALNARPALIAQRTDKAPLETFVLIANSEVQFSGLKDGTLVIDNSARGDLPRRWMSDYLLQSGSGEIADQFFADIENVSSAGHAILPVYFGKQDAAIVSEESYKTMCEHNPNISQRLHVICRSNPLLASVVCVRSDLSPQPRRELVGTLELLEQSADGKLFLDRIAASSLAPFKSEYLYHNREIHHRTAAAKTREEEGGGQN